MKKSNYNIIIDKFQDGNILLFNSLSCSLGVMENKYKHIYDDIENLDLNLITDKEYKKYIDIMIKNGFFIEDELDELKLIKTRSNMNKYRSDLVSLTIAPTLNCNMECPYCYEKKFNCSMRDDIKKNMVNFFDKRTNDCKSVSVCWYGGEPLLGLDTIVQLSSEFKKICNDKKIDYYSDMITNGYLLDYDTAISLRDNCNVKQVQITIDGFKDTHNKRRKLKNGEDSFTKIIDNIVSINDILNVIIRVNIDKENKNEIIPLVDYLLKDKNLKNKIHFDFSAVFDSEHCNIDKNNLINIGKFSEVSMELRKYLYDNNCIDIKHFIPHSRPYYCGACYINQYVIDPDGDIYKCWEIIGQKEYSIGNISSNDIQLNAEHVKWLNEYISHECIQCNIYPLCMGGCINKAFINNKNICDTNMLNFKENLRIIYNEFQSQNRDRAKCGI